MIIRAILSSSSRSEYRYLWSQNEILTDFWIARRLYLTCVCWVHWFCCLAAMFFYFSETIMPQSIEHNLWSDATQLWMVSIKPTNRVTMFSYASTQMSVSTWNDNWGKTYVSRIFLCWADLYVEILHEEKGGWCDWKFENAWFGVTQNPTSTNKIYCFVLVVKLRN